MKNINIPFYIMGFVSIILGILLFSFMQGNNSFVAVFIGALIAVGGVNVSSIFFYKVLTIKDEAYKYVFSFLHVITIIVMFVSTGVV